MISSSQPTISVIVPLRNGGENFRRCLLSLTEALPAPGEIIVVADGDTDGLWRLAEALGAKVVRISGPSGPGRARNFGARSAVGDVLLFVDADVVVGRDIIGRVAAAFENDPSVAAIFGSYDDEPGATNFLSQYKNLLHHYVHQTAAEEASTFWGACGAIRREVFLAIEGFDEIYRYPSIEDIELGYRLKQAGYRIRLCKALQVKHLKRWGVFSLLKSDLLHRALPWTELILRDHRFINDLNLRLSSRASVFLTYGLTGLLAASWWRPGALAVAGVLAVALLALNAPLYIFFQRKRGLRFALQATLWHWLYYFYSGLGFAVGVVLHTLPKRGWPGTPSAGATTERAGKGRDPELG
jgi:GT2 family glycosyltransferase